MQIHVIQAEENSPLKEKNRKQLNLLCTKSEIQEITSYRHVMQMYINKKVLMEKSDGRN